MTIRIANGAGFWGDRIDAPRRVTETTHVDYLTLEYLAELTMSILAGQLRKRPTAGFAGDFLTVLEDLVPILKAQPQLKIVTNAGGLNPEGCAIRAGQILAAAGLGDQRIGIVDGDDLSARLDEITSAGHPLLNFDTGEPMGDLTKRVVSANAYLGAAPIVEALASDARIVITGRVADASLTVGPAVHEFGWSWNDSDRIAAASVAGHIIECGAQATGGYSTCWRDMALANVGYPIAELESDGQIVITKPDGTGGAVTRRTVTEQIVYEVGDPAHYLTPDVDVDFTTVEVAELADNRVAVRGATGRTAPADYKVSIAYENGFTASGQLLVYGTDCVAKANVTAALITERLRQADFTLEETYVELLGAGDAVPGRHTPPEGLREVMMRMAVRDPRREAVARFAREIAPLITSGPAGLAGYAQGRPRVQPVFAYWPTLIPKAMLTPRVEVRSAGDWNA